MRSLVNDFQLTSLAKKFHYLDESELYAKYREKTAAKKIGLLYSWRVIA